MAQEENKESDIDRADKLANKIREFNRIRKESGGKLTKNKASLIFSEIFEELMNIAKPLSPDDDDFDKVVYDTGGKVVEFYLPYHGTVVIWLDPKDKLNNSDLFDIHINIESPSR